MGIYLGNGEGRLITSSIRFLFACINWYKRMLSLPLWQRSVWMKLTSALFAALHTANFLHLVLLVCSTFSFVKVQTAFGRSLEAH